MIMRYIIGIMFLMSYTRMLLVWSDAYMAAAVIALGLYFYLANKQNAMEDQIRLGLINLWVIGGGETVYLHAEPPDGLMIPMIATLIITLIQAFAPRSARFKRK